MLLDKRKALSRERRQIAARSLLETLKEAGSLLSFASFNSEIDTGPLNQFLAAKGCLYLPRVEGSSLSAYLVSDLEKQLVRSPSGILEPDPRLCPKAVSFSAIEAILVPGLGFDKDLFRLGYGKGHYDRFLVVARIHSIGVGFKEQSVEGPLPRDPWDVPTKELLLT